MKLITIQVFENYFEAHILKSRLENDGIKCFIHDENMVSLNPLYNVTLGGIKLKVEEHDVKKAKTIISEIENTSLTNDHNQAIRCPNCGSENIYAHFKSIKSIKALFAMLLSFLLFIYPPYYKTLNKCKECGSEFKH